MFSVGSTGPMTIVPEDERKRWADNLAAGAAAAPASSNAVPAANAGVDAELDTSAAASAQREATRKKMAAAAVFPNFADHGTLNSDEWDRYIIWLNLAALRRQEDREREYHDVCVDVEKRAKFVALATAKGVPMFSYVTEGDGRWYSNVRSFLGDNIRFYGNIFTHFFKGNSLQHLSVCASANDKQQVMERRVNEEVMRDESGNTLVINDGTYLHIFRKTESVQGTWEFCYAKYERLPLSKKNPDFARGTSEPTCRGKLYPHVAETEFFSAEMPRGQYSYERLRCDYDVFQVLRTNLDRIQRKYAESLAHLNGAAQQRVLLPELMRTVIAYSGMGLEYGILPPEARPDRAPAAPLAEKATKK